MRTLLNPEVMRAVRQLQEVMGRSGANPGAFGGAATATPTPTPSAANPTTQPSSDTATTNPPNTQNGATDGSGNNNAAGTGPGGANMNDWMSMMNAFNSAMGGLRTPAQPQPERTQEELEEMYSSQLQQLRDMGFLDKTMCLQALQQSQGNVSAANENLLSRFGG